MPSKPIRQLNSPIRRVNKARRQKEQKMSKFIQLKTRIPTVNIEIAAGNRRVFEITITADGQPYDLAAASLKMHIQPTHGRETIDGSGLLRISGNVLTLTMPPELTADAAWWTARYDIFNETTAQTLIRGEIRRIEVITK